MTIGAESLGVICLIAAISANSSFVALSELVGAWYVPSRTTLDAGVFATYPKSWNSFPLHMGASFASVYHLSRTSVNIVSSTASLVVDSETNPDCSST